MLKAIFKLLLANLLCVLIVIASVDRVPDPPVVKPHHDKAAKLCFGGQHRPAPDHNLIIEQALLHPLRHVIQREFSMESRRGRHACRKSCHVIVNQTLHNPSIFNLQSSVFNLPASFQPFRPAT